MILPDPPGQAEWLFSDPKYQLQLYQTLHPEDTETTIADLSLVTLETVIIKDIHNDLGIAVGTRLLALAEAQSTWSVNIIIRALLYLAHTYQSYLRKTKQSLYNTKPVSIPRAELYVIHTGDSQITKEEISLTEEFFAGIPCAMEVKVKVLVEGEGNDIINQYIRFSKVVTEQIRLLGPTKDAALETFRICKDRNILKEFIESHEKEAADIMVQLYSQKEALADFMESQCAESWAGGKAEGKAEGKVEGEQFANRKIAVRMQSKGKTLEEISDMLEIKVSQVAELLGLQMA